MINSADITLTPIDEKHCLEIASILNNDASVNQFVTFYHLKTTNGIILNGKIIGLFSLYKFIDDNIVIQVALLEEFRNKGIGGITLNKIVEEYGESYPETAFFLANTTYKNERAIKSIQKLGWDRTYRFDDAMNNEGSEFFVLYEKSNPYYNINCLNRKVMEYDTK